MRIDMDEMNIPNVPLRIDNVLNLKNVSAYCANTKEIINIPDIYHDEKFDFSGAMRYDKNFRYNSKSMLVFPLLDGESKIIGVFQLINRKDHTGNLTYFTETDQNILYSLSLLIGLVLSTNLLYTNYKNLFNSLIKLLAQNIEQKSPHTFDHIQNVTDISLLIANSLNENKLGIYKDVKIGNDGMEVLKTAGLLHDVGKISIPERIIAKESRLQILTDRMELLVERMNSKIKDLQIRYLKSKLEGGNYNHDSYLREVGKIKKDMFKLVETNATHTIEDSELKSIIDEYSKVSHRSFFTVNHSNNTLSSKVTSLNFHNTPVSQPIIEKEEHENLSITHGTLNQSERNTIKNHALKTWELLENLPFSEVQRGIPLYAGSHHETLDGTGYPYKISHVKMPIQSRILSFADILEALSTKSRPYRGALSVNQFMDIIGKMVLTKKLDGEIVKIFIQSARFKVFLDKCVSEGQIDDFDSDKWIDKYYVEPPHEEI